MQNFVFADLEVNNMLTMIKNIRKVLVGVRKWFGLDNHLELRNLPHIYPCVSSRASKAYGIVFFYKYEGLVNGFDQILSVIHLTK